MMQYNQMHGQPGFMGSNPMAYSPNMYYSPTAAMMGGHSATGMNPSLPQRQHSAYMQRQIELQAQNSIYGTGAGADRRFDALTSSMHGVLTPQQIAEAQRPGEARNFAMAFINQNPHVNRMFGASGNSMAVAMGARSMIDSSAGLGGGNFDMYGSARGRTTAAAQLTRSVMSDIQGDHGGVRAEYGGSFERVGFALQQLGAGGSMRDLMSMNKRGKLGIDKGASQKIKAYIKETTDTLELISDITGEIDNSKLSRIAAEMTGLDPTNVQNATRIKEMVGKQIATAELLGMTPQTFIGIQSRGASTLASAGIPQRAAGMWSARALTGSAIENERQQSEANLHGVAAMTIEEIHQRRMRSTAGMLGQGEPGTAGNLIVGINQALNMNKRAGGGMMSEEDVRNYQKALASGDVTQLQRAASDIGAKYNFDISAQGRYRSMSDRMRTFSVEEQAGIQDQLFAAQRGINKKKYWNRMIVGQFGLSRMGGFTGTEGRERLNQLGELFSQYGGETLNQVMGKSEDETAQELTKDPATIAEAKRLGVSPVALARKKAAQLSGIMGSVENVDALRGALSQAQDFTELDAHYAGSESDFQRGRTADKKAKAIADRRAKIKRAADRKAGVAPGGPLMSFTQGFIQGDPNIQGSLLDLSGEGLDSVAKELDKYRADVEGRIEAKAQERVRSGESATIEEAREAVLSNTGKGTLSKELRDVKDAEKRLKEIQREKQEVQPVRVVGDFRLVDDQGNTVTLQSANQN